MQDYHTISLMLLEIVHWMYKLEENDTLGERFFYSLLGYVLNCLRCFLWNTARGNPKVR